jgi:hypothetical protein
VEQFVPVVPNNSRLLSDGMSLLSNQRLILT